MNFDRGIIHQYLHCYISKLLLDRLLEILDIGCLFNTCGIFDASENDHGDSNNKWPESFEMRPHHCHAKAPQYMMDYCIHTSDIARRQHLRSAGCHQLFVLRHQRSMFGRRAFSLAGPAAWSSLPDYLQHLSRSFDSLCWDLKTSFLILLVYTVH